MTLDEAIEHAEGVASNCEGECADEHRQLAEWLRELKEWKKLAEGIDLRPASLMVPFQPNVNDLERENDSLKAENERLRKECTSLRKAREREFAASCEAATNHMLEVGKLRDENAKLRELVKAFNWCTENFDLQCKCDSCPLGQSDKLTPECEVRMRELGMEAEYGHE